MPEENLEINYYTLLPSGMYINYFNFLHKSVIQLWYGSNGSPTCPQSKRDTNIVILGTAMPAPEDVRLNLDNKG